MENNRQDVGQAPTDYRHILVDVRRSTASLISVDARECCLPSCSRSAQSWQSRGT